MERAVRPNLHRLDAVYGVVHRAGWTGEVKDVIDFAAIEGLIDVDFTQLEAAVITQVFDVGPTAGNKIVDGDDGVSFSQ